MIHNVTINGKALDISVNPIPVARRMGEDQTLWQQVSDESAINKKAFYIAKETILYFESGPSLHLAPLIIDTIKADEGLKEVIGESFLFTVGFDESVYILTVAVGEHGPVVENEEILNPQETLTALAKRSGAKFYFSAGIQTAALTEIGAEDGGIIDFFGADKDYIFSRVTDINRILTYSFAGVFAAAILYFIISTIIALIPEEVIIVTKKSPMITSDLSAVLGNIAESQKNYIPALSYGLNRLELHATGGKVSMIATGKLKESLTTPILFRLQTLATQLNGDLSVTSDTWEIANMPSVFQDVLIAPRELVDIQPQIFGLLSINGGGIQVDLSEPSNRNTVNSRYVEYQSNITIDQPTESRLILLAQSFDMSEIPAQYVHHHYTIRNEQFESVTIKSLIRGY